MTSCCASVCPDPVSTINQTVATVTPNAVVVPTISEVSPVDPSKKTVSLQVAVAGHWLIRCWLQDVATPGDAETLMPPDVPGASVFYKTTDAAGLSQFNIEHSSSDTWYLMATVVGPVTPSAIIITS